MKALCGKSVGEYADQSEHDDDLDKDDGDEPQRRPARDPSGLGIDARDIVRFARLPRTAAERSAPRRRKIHQHRIGGRPAARRVHPS
jgi:hypothetical protein